MYDIDFSFIPHLLSGRCPDGRLHKALLEGIPDGGVGGRCKKCDPKSYFDALAWNLRMYRTGTCPDVDFVFKGTTGPCIKHCRAYLKTPAVVSGDQWCTTTKNNGYLLLEG